MRPRRTKGDQSTGDLRRIEIRVDGGWRMADGYLILNCPGQGIVLRLRYAGESAVRCGVEGEGEWGPVIQPSQPRARVEAGVEARGVKGRAGGILFLCPKLAPTQGTRRNTLQLRVDVDRPLRLPLRHSQAGYGRQDRSNRSTGNDNRNLNTARPMQAAVPRQQTKWPTSPNRTLPYRAS